MQSPTTRRIRNSPKYRKRSGNHFVTHRTPSPPLSDSVSSSVTRSVSQSTAYVPVLLLEPTLNWLRYMGGKRPTKAERKANRANLLELSRLVSAASESTPSKHAMIFCRATRHDEMCNVIKASQCKHQVTFKIYIAQSVVACSPDLL